MGNSKFSVSGASTLLFPDFLRAQNMVRVTEGKITVKCMTEIHGKSILLRVCAKFELSGVNCNSTTQNETSILLKHLQ